MAQNVQNAVWVRLRSVVEVERVFWKNLPRLLGCRCHRGTLNRPSCRRRFCWRTSEDPLAKRGGKRILEFQILFLRIIFFVGPTIFSSKFGFEPLEFRCSASNLYHLGWWAFSYLQFSVVVVPGIPNLLQLLRCPTELEGLLFEPDLGFFPMMLATR